MYFLGSKCFPVCAWQMSRQNSKRASPVLCVLFYPVKSFKGFLARLFNDRVTQSGTIKDLMILGKNTMIFTYYYVYIQVSVDEFARDAGVRRCWQNNIAVSVREGAVFLIRNVYCIPGTRPEVC